MRDVTVQRPEVYLLLCCFKSVWILGNKELKLPPGQCWLPPALQLRRIKGSRESVPGDAAYRDFQKSCCCPRSSFNPVRAQLWAHLALPNRAENASFPSETLRQGAQVKWRDRSVQCCSGTWARILPWASTDMYRPHRHSSAIHILKPGTRKRLMLQEPLSPLAMWWHCSVYVSPPYLPVPKAPSFVSIPAFRSASWGNVAAHSWICSLIQLCHPPQKTNAPFGWISHRDLCWIKAITWLLASQRSRTPLTPHVWPLTAYFRHTSISASSPATDHNGGLKQTVQRLGRRKGLL